MSDQIISFVLYSTFIYPITSYLISKKRPYKRWKGVLYTILFLILVAGLQLSYDNQDLGPNRYSLLNIKRDFELTTLKKYYRKLSLELHPDKNKSPNSSQEFNYLSQSYEILSDIEMRRIYDLHGDRGIKLFIQGGSIDNKMIIKQMLFYYSSTVIYSYVMTLSEPSGHAFSTCILILMVMFIIEIYLMIEEIQIPMYCFPYHTPHDIITFLHKVYPTVMNAARCTYGSFYEDRKDIIVIKLMELFKYSTIIRQKTMTLISNVLMMTSNNNNNNNNNNNGVYICNSEDVLNNGIDVIIDNNNNIDNHIINNNNHTTTTNNINNNDVINKNNINISLVTIVNNEIKLENVNSITIDNSKDNMTNNLNILKENNITNNNNNKHSLYILFQSLIIFIILKFIINYYK